MRGKWFGLGCLTSLVLLVVILVLSISGINNYLSKYRGESKKITDRSWLIIDLEGELPEFSELSQDFWGKQQKSAHNYIQAIQQAANDDKITGMIIRPQFVMAGYATLNGMMEAMKEFKASGKPVYAYLSNATNKGYYLASAADRIYLNPSSSAGILLTGVGGHILYFEELLDHLGVDMQVIHAGRFKAAGEQFVRNEMSPEFRQNLNELYKDIYQQMLITIADNRGIEMQELQRIYEKRDNIWINGEYSLKSGLADELIQYQELLTRNDIKKSNSLSIDSYPQKVSIVDGDKIGILYASGNITMQAQPAIDVITSEKFLKNLKKLEENPKVKAIVVRVNSPGGSALESDIILNAIKNAQRTKPVLISMGDVAASGGYYISCSADQIFADPMTITGSIGVVSIIPNLNEMGNKIGVSSSSVHYGRYSDILNPWEKPDEQEIAAVRSSIMEIYDEFKSHVSSGRELTLNEVEEIAQGRVWSSSKAKEAGLIDEIGDLDMAVSKAAELAGITKYAKIYLPEQKSMMEILLKEYFDIEMSIKLITGELEYLGMLQDIQLIKAIRDDPNQAYCPVVID